MSDASDAIEAYRAQIEGAGLPVVEVRDGSDWTTIVFRYEFNAFTLSVPNDMPTYCKLETGFTIDSDVASDRIGILSRANENTKLMRIVKTAITFDADESFVKFSCEFFTDQQAGFAIKPGLSRYLGLLGGAFAEFHRNADPDDSSEE